MESQYFFETTPHGCSYLTFLLSPPAPPEPINDHWTFEENKIFERCIAELDPLSRDFFERIALRVPRKSIGQIQRHFEALFEDVEKIESGRVPIPDYDKAKKMVDKSTHKVPRRRGVPWSNEEHELFLEGLEKYGKGDWKSISRNCVRTRNPTQVASHAQKYYKRLKKNSERRRLSQLIDPLALPYAFREIYHPSSYMSSLRPASTGNRRIGHSLAYYLGKN